MPSEEGEEHQMGDRFSDLSWHLSQGKAKNLDHRKIDLFAHPVTMWHSRRRPPLVACQPWLGKKREGLTFDQRRRTGIL